MYEAPKVEVIEVKVERGFTISVSGYAPDSDDSEFGWASERRGEWGNLWED